MMMMTIATGFEADRDTIRQAATHLARKHDPARLMRDFGLEPDPWQAGFLRSCGERVLILASRQVGKSQATACLALHRILYTSDSLVVLLSPTQRQSGELYLKLRAMYDAIDRPVAARKETETTLSLENGSRVVSLPGSGNTVRSYSRVDLTIIDECAMIADDLVHAVSPMRAVSGGRLICLSSPKGQRGIFHDWWEHGGPEWERYRVTADQCPRISPAFLEDERKNLGDAIYEQEYMCRFVQSVDQVFATELIDRAFSSRKPPLFAPAASADRPAAVPASDRSPLAFQAFQL